MAVGAFQVLYFILYQSPFMVPNVGLGNRLIKNNLRIFLGSRFNIFKNIEAQKKLCHFYKNMNLCILIELSILFQLTNFHFLILMLHP